MANEVWLSVAQQQLQGATRTDLWALDSFTHGATPDQWDAMRLYWSVRDPEAMNLDAWDDADRPIRTGGQVPPLLPEIEQAFLETIAGLEHTWRAHCPPGVNPYEGPTDSETAADFATYAHVAAAAALALTRAGDRSEGALECLERARQSGCLLTGRAGGCLRDFVPDVSTWAVTSLVLLESFHVHERAGTHAEALHCLAEGLRHWTEALEGTQPDAWDDEDDHEWRRRLSGYLRSLPFDKPKAVDVAERLLAPGSEADWSALANDCRTLAHLWSEGPWGNDDSVTDPNDNQLQWFEYWLRAQGRAEGRLSRDQFREAIRLVLEQTEREQKQASEKRLIAYSFYEGTWAELPQRVKDALVNADWLWFSPVGRIEAIYHELKIAAETLCYRIIWERLRDWKGDQRFLAFVHREAELLARGRDGHDPSLDDYAWVCRQSFFAAYVDLLPLDDSYKLFMKDKDRLAYPLRLLNQLRGSADHKATYQGRREVLDTVYRQFLGMGQKGVLPLLARIYVKMSGTASRKKRG